MKIEHLVESSIHGRFRQAAQNIVNHRTNPSACSPPPDSDLAPMEDLLRRQARQLVSFHDENPHLSGDKGKEQGSQRDKSNSSPSEANDSSHQPKSNDGSHNTGCISREDGPVPKTSQSHDSTSIVDKLALVRSRIGTVIGFAHKKMYAYVYHEVPKYWRCLYTDAYLILGYYNLLCMVRAYSGKHGDAEDDGWFDEIIRNLDQALITTNAESQSLNGQEWIEGTMESCYELLKRSKEGRKKALSVDEDSRCFSTEEPFERPTIGSPVPKLEVHWSMDRFESYMLDPKKSPEPLIIPGLLEAWPALNEHPWNSVDYLLAQTLGGRRQVPVEIGRSYVDREWGQEIISFRKFLDVFVLRPPSEKRTGYLAQHELFRQIPQLRNDIQIPDYCWSDTLGHPLEESKNKPKLEMPNMNAWFGPAGTITPLHTDGYHNLLCQVVGTKYVRLYAPDHLDVMEPRGREDGIDMGNTSSLDVGVLEGWDEDPEGRSEEELRALRKRLEGVKYVECILEPGDTLLIPMGWWHYVRSLSVSFSVSFWWN